MSQGRQSVKFRSPDRLARTSLLLGVAGVLLGWVTLAIGAIAALPALLSSLGAVIRGTMALFRGSQTVERRFRYQAISGIIFGVLFLAFVLFVALTAHASAGSY